MEVSPLKALHLILKPMNRIKLYGKEEPKKLIPISSMHTNFCSLNYIEDVPIRARISTICENSYCSIYQMDQVPKLSKRPLEKRIIYKPLFNKTFEDTMECKIHVGTMKGKNVC